MLKWITPRIAKNFIFSMAAYMSIVLLHFASLVGPVSVFGRAGNLLIFLLPIVVFGEAIRGILVERKRMMKAALQDQRDQSHADGAL